jgi:hypothetical protein
MDIPTVHKIRDYYIFLPKLLSNIDNSKKYFQQVCEKYDILNTTFGIDHDYINQVKNQKESLQNYIKYLEHEYNKICNFLSYYSMLNDSKEIF